MTGEAEENMVKWTEIKKMKEDIKMHNEFTQRCQIYQMMESRDDSFRYRGKRKLSTMKANKK